MIIICLRNVLHYKFFCENFINKMRIIKQRDEFYRSLPTKAEKAFSKTHDLFIAQTLFNNHTYISNLKKVKVIGNLRFKDSL